jgi:hypothetical protein
MVRIVVEGVTDHVNIVSLNIEFAANTADVPSVRVLGRPGTARQMNTKIPDLAYVCGVA